MSDQSRRARGRWGEDRAVAHLRRSGYRIVARNWRSPEPGLRGELDVVAQLDDLLVVCEVKARRSSDYGGAAAAVDAGKQARIRDLTASWLRCHGEPAGGVRFDVIAIDGVALAHHEAAL